MAEELSLFCLVNHVSDEFLLLLQRRNESVDELEADSVFFGEVSLALFANEHPVHDRQLGAQVELSSLF